MKAKPWQIMVIVLGLVGGGGFLAWNLFSVEDDGVSDSYLLIDVESGTIFRVDNTKYHLGLPATNPETGKVSLIGLSRDDGGLFVSKRDLATLQLVDAGVPNKAVDPTTGELLITPGKPVDYRPKR